MDFRDFLQEFMSKNKEIAEDESFLKCFEHSSETWKR